MALRQLAGVTILGVLIGCQAILGIDEGKPRPDGNGGAGGSGGSGQSSSSGSVPLCMLDSDCQDMPADCRAPKCIQGFCGFTNEPLGTPCSVNGGTSCAGNGMCVPASCMDGMTDGTETDKDCGGSQCAPCAQGQQCKMASDCLDGVCMGVCQAPTCSDGIKNGQETDVDCGMACPIKCFLGNGCTIDADCVSDHCAAFTCSLVPTVLVLAGGATSTLAGTLHPPGVWSTMPFVQPSTSGLGVAFLSTGQAVGLLRLTKLGDPQNNNLMFTTWTGNTWAPLTVIAANVTTSADVSLSAASVTGQAAYRGTDAKHYYAAFTSPSWSPQADPVGGAAMQSAGNTAPAIAASGNDAVVAFAGNDTNLYVQTRTGGMWQPSYSLGGPVTLSPSIIKLTGGSDFMVAFVQSGSGQIVYSIGSGTSWTAAIPVPSATTTDAVSLAALPAGAAAIAYRASNMQLYTAVYKPGQMPPWSLPTTVGVTTIAAPSIAPGVAGATLELAYLSSNKLYHTRYLNNAWTAPANVANGTFSRVAIAVAP